MKSHNNTINMPSASWTQAVLDKGVTATHIGPKTFLDIFSRFSCWIMVKGLWKMLLKQHPSGFECLSRLWDASTYSAATRCETPL